MKTTRERAMKLQDERWPTRAARWFPVVIALEGSWLFACEAWRDSAPWALLAMVLVPWMLLAATWRSTLREGYVRTLGLLFALVVADAVLDLLNPYPRLFTFAAWEAARALAVFVGAFLAPRVASWPSFGTRLLRGASLAVAATIPASMAYIAFDGSRDESSPADAAIVLGATLDEDGRALPRMLGRVAHAVEIQRRGLVPRLLLSGGAAKAGRSEASVMKELAVAGGVPSEALVIEASSRSTIENFACSRPILEALGARRILVVTEQWHMSRAMLLARRHRLDVRASPATSAIWRSPRHAGYWLFRDANAYVRESLRQEWAEPGRCAATECEGCRVMPP